MPPTSHSRKLEEEILPLRERLAAHEAMSATADPLRARCFLGCYAFLVWDFMTQALRVQLAFFDGLAAELAVIDEFQESAWARVPSAPSL